MTTLRQQIGQMLVMGFSEAFINEQSSVAQWLSTDGLGGVLLFNVDLIHKRSSKNLINQEQIKQLTQQLKNYAKQSKSYLDQSLLPFIAIDYEGGIVDRLSQIEGCPKTKKPSELIKLSDAFLQKELEKMAETLQSLGFNLNFAPVVDLNLNEKEGIIGKLGRSFSKNPVEVTGIAHRMVSIFAEFGISCCYKHFPGHGSASADSHQGFVDVTDSFQESELEPYALLANKNPLAMIMTAHVINRKLDPSGLPATLSEPILNGLLRQKLGFKGVIISDDLQMHAISKHYSIDEALRLTINAGADMLIFANQLEEITPNEVIDRIQQLVHSNQIDENRIKQSYQRILAMKSKQLMIA